MPRSLVYRRGETLPRWSEVLRDVYGQVVDLTSAISARIICYDSTLGVLVFDEPLVIATPPTLGLVHFNPTVQDVDLPSEGDVSIIVTWAGGKRETWPSQGFYYMRVLPSAGAGIPSIVSVTPATGKLNIGATLQLSAEVLDVDGVPLSSGAITWTSSNPAVATVSSTGLVTALAVGAVTITATSGTVTGTAAVTIPAVDHIVVAPASASLGSNETQQLTATLYDVDNMVLTGRVVTWSSSNTGVATVSSTGLVTGVGNGTATITATSEDKTATSTMTVVALLPPAAQSALVLAFDPSQNNAQSGNPIVGPAYQLGSSASADTNDPVLVPAAGGVPAYFAFDADDFVTFGDVLDNVFTNAAGFAIIAGINRGQPEIDVQYKYILSKRNFEGANGYPLGSEFSIVQQYRALLWITHPNGDENSYDQWMSTSNTLLVQGRQVVAVNFDPSQARNSRGKIYFNGAAVGINYGGTGTDHAITDTPAHLIIGARPGEGMSGIGPVYIYNRPLTTQEHADNAAWLAAQGWA